VRSGGLALRSLVVLLIAGTSLAAAAAGGAARPPSAVPETHLCNQANRYGVARDVVGGQVYGEGLIRPQFAGVGKGWRPAWSIGCSGRWRFGPTMGRSRWVAGSSGRCLRFCC